MVDRLTIFISINKQPKKYIGYWRRNFYNIFDKFPFPVPSIIKLDQSDIISKTKNILLNFGITESYFGYSHCRLCKLDKNEYFEYWINYNNYTYVIPAGYFHYLIEHNVKIDDKLVEIVNYYSTINN